MRQDLMAAASMVADGLAKLCAHSSQHSPRPHPTVPPVLTPDYTLVMPLANDARRRSSSAPPLSGASTRLGTARAPLQAEGPVRSGRESRPHLGANDAAFAQAGSAPAPACEERVAKVPMVLACAAPPTQLA